MRFISLFAGIGGFDLGLERAGMTCVAQVEKDAWCRQVLKKHWPDVPQWEDIYDVRGNDLPAAELICGGFPCQPFSTAGKRQGTRDDRHLWPEYFRIIQEIRPRWVLGENVPGIINLALDDVLLDLESAGYATETLIIPACAVDAQHRRDRVWIVAHTVETGAGNNAGKIGNERRRETATGAAALRQAHGTTGASGIDAAGEAMAHADKQRLQGRQKAGNTESGGEKREEFFTGRGRWWPTEPAVGRVANGIPRRVDRLRGLGNAVVPQVVEVFGRFIMQIDKECHDSSHHDM